ncbi:probable protein phosphatase 2C 55 [Lycium ferocissimum]|uniref:probable protein phosphatase 2C 55 n=1 Tax=Lycium ferocissimum TaxID=112874 RepID=UPI00281504ED|nr:probable protein phosphatase 2C 55 [Lycium ferocissimum]XP_059285514.1 probable protein phosphatase 2C 55 [Lycium ferocissimum]XP_059285515.1 probable protein phosphatase 2C 55 [Lycium ferocissimum]XP_059285516.1 probable protein phosphatase 2C 55 [Lycium ferocissimum]
MPSNYLFRLSRAARQGLQKSISGQQESGLRDSVEILVAQGRLLFGNSKYFYSTDLNVLVRPGTLAAAQANLHIVNQKKNLSVVGAISRAVSIPSVSGPAFHICGYHIDRLISDPAKSLSDKAPMEICGSRASPPGCVSGKMTSGHLNVVLSVNNPITSYSNRSFDNCRKASMSLRNKNQPNNFLLYGYFAYNVAKRRENSDLYEGLGLTGFHTSSTTCSSTGTAHDVSFGNSTCGVQLLSSADSSEQNIHIDRTLKLNSGSCYLPHPDKEETGGEDAHFICNDEQAIGVADGVGGWADLGVDAGLYARELMSNSVTAIQDEPKGSVDPARVLDKAHTCTKAKGSSTACIIALTDQGLHAINLGDSGFIVVRDGCTVFRSPVQQHDFNITFQLECGSAGDLPSSGEVFKIPVAPGDVIIAGTDGLFDNLYNNDINAIVVHATRAGLGPQMTAQKIAALARQRAQDKNRQTPFSAAAQEAGFRYYGGKLDDITVVVSYISSDRNERSNSLQM